MRVVAIKADADLYHVACAARLYGSEVIEEVLAGIEHDDHEGNPFYVVPEYEVEDYDSCGYCRRPLD